MGYVRLSALNISWCIGNCAGMHRGWLESGEAAQADCSTIAVRHAVLRAPTHRAGMHEAAESGEAAHAAYKGGLAAGQAQRLAEWTQALQPPPGEAARHLDSAASMWALDGAPAGEADVDAAAVELFRCAQSVMQPERSVTSCRQLTAGELPPQQ